MPSKQFIVFLFVIIAVTTNARIMRMSRGNSCQCRYRIENERNDAIKKYNGLSDNLDKLKEFVTLNSCPIGHEFNYENSMLDTLNIKCDKCPNNYYRTKYNSTCLHCPEGFVSSTGNVCKKGEKKELINTKYCPKGSIIGNDRYATYGKSCIICDNLKKEYMPNKNIEDKCLICPSGSVVKDNLCIKCQIGYYESNNKCIECDAGTYHNIEGSKTCNKCNNDKSLSYHTIGGNNCDDSYLFDISNKVNEIVNIKKISEPVIYSLQIVSGMIYSNRKMIMETSSKLTMFGGFGIATYMIIVSP